MLTMVLHTKVSIVLPQKEKKCKFAIHKNCTKRYTFIMENKNKLIKHDKRIASLLASHKDNPNYKKTLDSYNNKVYKVSDTGITYRTISSWESANLLLAEPNKNEKWRKFSIIEVLWLQIIKELRSIGFSKKKIHNLKNQLFRTREIFGNSITDTFAVYLFSFNGERDVVIIVDQDGNGDFAIDLEYEMSLRDDKFPNTHVVLNLNKIYADFSGDTKFRQRNQYFWIYNNQQLELLNAIYNDPMLKEIIIKPKNGEIDKLDFKRQIDNPANVIDAVGSAIKEGKRRKIVINIEPNKVVSIEDTLKK